MTQRAHCLTSVHWGAVCAVWPLLSNVPDSLRRCNAPVPIRWRHLRAPFLHRPTPATSRCGVVWCGVVWCGVVYHGVVWCAEGAVTKREWPGWSCRQKNASQEAVCLSLRCVQCVSYLGEWGEVTMTGPVSIQGCPGDALPLRLVRLEFSECSRHRTSWAHGP